MKISEIMSDTLVTIDMDDTLHTVKNIFDNSKFHHLIVVEQDKIYGVISDRDLLKSLSPGVGTASETSTDLALLNKKTHQIMTRKPITLKPGNSIIDAINIFNQHKISCIPVVDDTQKPVGIVSWRDILKALSRSYSQ